MIDFYFWPTPNGWKVAMLLNELGVEYRTIPVNIGRGEQFEEAFLRISPNNRMPAIVDHDVTGESVSVFESGAILWYLADKHSQFLSADPIERKETLEWLFWQVGGQGPMAGQLSHFVNYAPEDERSYGQRRYKGEYERLAQVLENRLEGREWLVGNAYSIADMICWPWILIAKPLGVDLTPFPNVTDWRARIKARTATQSAVDLGRDFDRGPPLTEAERDRLYFQSAGTLKQS